MNRPAGVRPSSRLRQRIAVGAWLAGAAVAAGLLATGVKTGLESRRLFVQFEQCRTRGPLEATVNLSETGETVVPYRQLCTYSCGSILWTPLPEAGVTALDGLSGHLTVHDESDVVLGEVAFDAERFHQPLDRVHLTELPRDVPEGEWTAVIRIDAPAAAAGSTSLHGDYRMCGLEIVPAYIAAAIAVGCCVFGAILALALLPGLIRTVTRLRNPPMPAEAVG
ncbi:hypothetical protein [Alienimonas chondri]|uniref:Uncharacterized protein n=1 Tax=Alienimonas chondri TaxID=2681879 RepID=A0ABX1VFD3_9PLAN|nr:hypothetical protein [Alienimonas chondri]NNJ26814.1 hypothetical protein [Alienimonas chondri]